MEWGEEGACSLSCLFLNHRGADDADIVFRAVILVGGHHLYAGDGVHSLYDVAEDGVLPIQVGRASMVFIDLPYPVGEFYLSFGGGIHSFLYGSQLLWHIEAACHDEELRPAGCSFRIHLVWLACHGEGATAMKEFGKTDFGRHRMLRFARAQELSGFGMARVGVSHLYQETVDGTVYQQTVIVPFAHQFQEIVAV